MLRLHYYFAMVICNILALASGTNFPKALQILNECRNSGTEEGNANITQSDTLTKEAQLIAEMDFTIWINKSSGIVLKQIIAPSGTVCNSQAATEKAIENFAQYAGLTPKFPFPDLTKVLTVSSKTDIHIVYNFREEPIVKSVQGKLFLAKAVGGIGDLVVMKRPSSTEENESLRVEADTLEKIGSHASIVKLLHAGESSDNMGFVAVFEMMLSDLYHMRVLCGEVFSLETSIILIKELIDTVAFIHSKDFVHLDIKEENIMIVLEGGKYRVKLIDFGAAERYRENGKVFSKQKDFRGSPETMSFDAHYGEAPMPSDDIWSILFTFMLFVRGSLPWENQCCRVKEIRGDTSKTDEMLVLLKKIKNLKNTEFCNFLEDYPELKDVVWHLDDIKKKPQVLLNYDGIKDCFDNIMKNRKTVTRGKLDWDERLQLLLRPGKLREAGIGVHLYKDWNIIFLLDKDSMDV